MKKSLFLAAIVAAAMSSCSSDDTLTLAQQLDAEAQAQGLVPVNLSLNTASASVTETRGTGIVGDLEGGTNDFQYENIYVLMMDVTGGDLHPWTYSTCGGALGTQFDNSFFCRPEATGEAGVFALNYKQFTGNALKYYPLDTRSDFFGYYIDDAATGLDADNNPNLTVGETDITLDFTLNGSQDIMAGKATNYADGATNNGYDKRGYSGTSARDPYNIVPRIDMKHLLSRFTFEVKSGDDQNVATQLQVDAITIAAQATGTLTVAVQDEDGYDIDQLITWKDEPLVDMTLMQKDPAAAAATLVGGKPAMIAMVPFQVGANGTVTQAGGDYADGFYVKPNETEYDIVLHLSQLAQTGVEADGVTPILTPMTHSVPLKVKLTNGGKFQRAKSYHVAITVYGLHEVELKASLEAWGEGDEVEPLNTEN
ncbi:MAG: fimbrillin family protein [Bacteroidaceae bacterium]|nr:fimbrillin family protein [Bacteroidaceae bacterium]